MYMTEIKRGLKAKKGNLKDALAYKVKVKWGTGVLIYNLQKRART